MADSRTGFAVLYRWEVRPGAEDAFLEAWASLTRLVRDHGGGRGSRLHRGDDGLYYGYAQWPDRATWEAVWQLPEQALSLRAAMSGATVHMLDPILLDPVGDLLLSD